MQRKAETPGSPGVYRVRRRGTDEVANKMRVREKDMSGNYERTYVLHTEKQGNLVIKESDAIANALEQEKDGIEPHYIYCDKYGTIGNPGWLVWSTWDDGCGVVYRRDDGKMIVTTGWQGSFAYC